MTAIAASSMAIFDFLYSEGFEQFNQGKLAGQDGWSVLTKGGPALVQNDFVLSGKQALELQGPIWATRAIDLKGTSLGIKYNLSVGPNWGAGTETAIVGSEAVLQDKAGEPYRLTYGVVRTGKSRFGEILPGSAGIFVQLTSRKGLEYQAYQPVKTASFDGTWANLSLSMNSKTLTLAYKSATIHVPQPRSVRVLYDMTLINTGLTSSAKTSAFIDDLHVHLAP